MSIQRFPRFLHLCASVLVHSDSEQDPEKAASYARSLRETEHQDLLNDLNKMLQSGVSLEDLGTEANRWFSSNEEAQKWIQTLSQAVEEASSAIESDPSDLAMDSNGTPLQEGDSVTVIKDLKVRGGSSDLKRGTLIKKIHLTGDPSLIECRVEGSVLVLRTEFLKKS
jgi:protein PhnA